MKTADFYERLHHNAGEVLALSVKARPLHHAHTLAGDLAAWADLLGPRLEAPLISAASRDIQHSTLCALTGLYRSAFGSLRLALERVLGTIFLSMNELNLRLRIRGQRDQSWSAIVAADTGLFSTDVATAFFPGLATTLSEHRDIATSVYRLCSELVHGNPIAEKDLPSPLVFDAPTLDKWIGLVSSSRTVFSYALSLRYLRDLDNQATETIADHLDSVCHIPAIRAKTKASNE